MSLRPFVGLVSLGPVDLKITQHLGKAISNFLATSIEILPPKSLPPHTYNAVRNQYNSTQLLEYLLQEYHDEPFRILAITGVDLYIPIFTFVFGEAQLDGKAAIISTFRPQGGDSLVAPSRSVFLERLVKLGLHELGHTLGLPHCRREYCLMNFSANLEKLDQKQLEICKYCQVLLDDYLKGVNGV